MPESTAARLPGLNLRFAGEADAEVILDLIRGLAEFEKLSHEVVADAHTLRRFLFGRRRRASLEGLFYSW